jgi:hypothetical protein
MGRTIHKYREDDDSRRKNKSAKHSKNIPGHGMRVINNWSEENYDEESYETEDEYYDNTTFTQGK